ncbi:hypothetical protein [Flavobacterium sp. '19STA2R22 D10 B1']|uniref:hypothetical protein n=1 Tax=Flavobacterium aerium TaxID=3037261 RepID=UPI00278C3141|nr:hypothetical protein [Flavobacterium sp. '19STA2R22 D10 B1']
MNQLSKDQIKDRLLKRAAKKWGYSDVELENVFDPIVNLLFDVCSKELEKISNEVFSSRRRITERLVDILTPIASSKATPARAIMKAYPSENEVILNDHHQFYIQKKEINPYNPSENLLKDYFFGATKPVKITRNKLRYVVLPNGIQEVIKDQFKEVLSSDLYTKPLQHGTIWLGIQHQGDGIMKDLMFYFYLKNISNRNTFFHFLPRAKWYLNDHLLTTSEGYNTDDSFSKRDSKLIQEDFYHIERTEEHVNEYYEKNFISIKDIFNIEDNTHTVPAEFKQFLSTEDLKQLSNEKVIWLRLEFPNVINKNMLSDVFCATNCFPVINKKLNETQGSIKSLMNIYPLNIGEDFFLELYSVLDDKNREFDVIKNNNHEQIDDYAYLRFGGVARFDERNATEEINYLIDLVRDEAAAFSSLGHDFTDTNLKEINQIISRFRNKMAQVGMHKKNTPYLVLNSKNKKDRGTLFVKYWTTNGEDANKINTFSRLLLYKGSDFEKDSMTLLSTTQGGKNELTNSEKIYAYRENLISNQRVVTKQDIIILCKNHYGESIENVTVKTGIQTSLDSNIGYMPTIDIYLKRKDETLFNEEEWNFLSEDLMLRIKNRAINIVPFRIIYN